MEELVGEWCDNVGQEIEVCGKSGETGVQALFSHNGVSWVVPLKVEHRGKRGAIICGKFDIETVSRGRRGVTEVHWLGNFPDSNNQPRRLWTRRQTGAAAVPSAGPTRGPGVRVVRRDSDGTPPDRPAFKKAGPQRMVWAVPDKEEKSSPIIGLGEMADAKSQQQPPPLQPEPKKPPKAAQRRPPPPPIPPFVKLVEQASAKPSLLSEAAKAQQQEVEEEQDVELAEEGSRESEEDQDEEQQEKQAPAEGELSPIMPPGLPSPGSMPPGLLPPAQEPPGLAEPRQTGKEWLKVTAENGGWPSLANAALRRGRRP